MRVWWRGCIEWRRNEHLADASANGACVSARGWQYDYVCLVRGLCESYRVPAESCPARGRAGPRGRAPCLGAQAAGAASGCGEVSSRCARGARGRGTTVSRIVFSLGVENPSCHLRYPFSMTIETWN